MHPKTWNMGSRLPRFTLAALAVLACLMAAACASPTTPTGAATATDPGSGSQQPANSGALVRLTVRVLSRGSEVPVPGAVVTVLNATGRTDAAGECAFSVKAGESTEVDVSAAGFQPMGASAVHSGDEQWTFYLAVPPSLTN